LAHEHAALVVEAVALDRFADLPTHPFPAIRRRAARGRLGKLERAIDGRPAHHFRVHEVSRFAADLPDPPIGLGPALARGVDHLDDELPIVVVGRTAALVPAPCEVHGFPVHVELLLPPRVVADPNRRTAAVALQVLELDLGQATLAADPVHNLDVRTGAGRASFDEPPETFGLLLVPELEERAHREGRVADPAIAVVPVRIAGDERR